MYRYTTIINLNHDLPESDIIEESISTQTLDSLLLLPVSGSSFCTYYEWVFWVSLALIFFWGVNCRESCFLSLMATIEPFGFLLVSMIVKEIRINFVWEKLDCLLVWSGKLSSSDFLLLPFLLLPLLLVERGLFSFSFTWVSESPISHNN